MAILLQSCAITPYDIDSVVKAREEIPKSPNDDRHYRYLKLANNLRVVLISDQDTDRAAASLSVYRGNYSDPDAYPGLAYFLEHMLFVGTQKYPDPDGFSIFVESHGGSQNAAMGTDYTNFFFDIQPGYFRQAMDRFTQFFVSPKLDYDYVEREKNAVDSEYRLYLKDDGWRAQIARTVAANPDHPYVKFSIGNLETLDSGVHEALRSFFEDEYSSNQMGLVVLSNEPLDVIESWVVRMAMEIENRALAPHKVSEPLFLPGQLPATLTHQSLEQNHSLLFSFPLPLLDPFYRQKPGNYLANLIGHEGEGSLHRVLIEKGWITWLSAGGVKADDSTSLLAVSIGLTEEGRDHVPQITDLLFDYIELLKSQDPEEWRFKEQGIVSDLAFRFEEESDPLSTVYGMSPDLASYPPKDLLTYPYLMEEFDPELINEYLGYLRLDNVLLEVIGHDVQTDSVESWFKVGYSLDRGPLSIIEAVPGELDLPEPNTFLPQDLTIREDDGQGPRLVFDDKSGQIWFDVDTEFGVPRSNIDISLRDAQGLISLQNVVSAALYKRLVWDDLNTLVYPAFLAGVGYRVSSPPKGFRIATFGYNDRQLVLLNKLLASFVELDIKPDRFDVLKTELLRDLRNSQRDLPFRQTQSAVHDLLLSSSWGALEQADYLEAVSLKDMISWREAKLASVDVLAMVHGNVAMEDVEKLRVALDRHLSLQDFLSTKPQVREVNQAHLDEVVIDHDDA